MAALRRLCQHLEGDVGHRGVFQFRYPSYGEIAMRIAVAGGTGMVGKYVVEAITGAGHDAVVLSRSRGVDLRTDAGLAHALDGVKVIIDAANPDSITGAKATAFFTVTTRLQSVGSAQGVSRLVTLSIVGIDRVPGYGYYRAKLAQEAAATAGPVPVTIVRATQFHEFPAQILSRARFGPLAAMPVIRVQPVAARAVGQCLMEAAVEPPEDQMIEVAGPQPEDLVTMARRLAKTLDRRIAVLPIVVPGRGGRAMRGGQLLATPRTTLVGPTFADWLISDDAHFAEL
jgi:uncharacterized protein YbjT (DUF2867 family)